MKGGLLLNNKLKTITTIPEAVSMFQNIEYSTFKLLTNSSVSCITFKSTLKPHIISPFIEIRSDIYGKPVRSLLFKFFPIKNSERQKAAVAAAEAAAAKAKAAAAAAKAKAAAKAATAPAAVAAAKVAAAIADDAAAAVDAHDYFTTQFDRGNKNIIEIADDSKLIKEYLLQLKIYQQTYNTISSAYEPVCPYPIHYDISLNKNSTIDNIISLLENTSNKKKITNEIMDTLGYESNTHSDEELERREHIFKLGCIIMEFMEDFVPLKEYVKTLSYNISNQKYKKIQSLISYELSRLHSIGVIHGDIHLGNFMYNSKYKYITDGTKSEDLGRVIIIDFGRSKDNMKSYIKELNKEVYIDLYKKHGKDANDAVGEKNLNYYYINKHDKDANDANDAVGEKNLNYYYINKHDNIKKIKKWYDQLYTFEFYKPYTFEYIYSKRLELTLQFRKTIINKTITDINQFIKDHPNNLQNYSNDFKLAISLLQIKPLYPLNFATPATDYLLEDFIDNLNEKEKKLQKEFNITKKVKINKTSKVKNITSLEKMSQIGLNTLKNLNTMFTKMFTKSKKQTANQGRGKNKLYHYLRYSVFTKKLNNNIKRQLTIHSKILKRLKSQKKIKHYYNIK
jgi:hypothetical protein